MGVNGQEPTGLPKLQNAQIIKHYGTDDNFANVKRDGNALADPGAGVSQQLQSCKT